MSYVFDNSSISKLKHYSPEVFPKIWTELDNFAKEKIIISTKEVYRELQNGVPNAHTDAWVKKHKRIFTVPTVQELAIVSEVLSTKNFSAIIGAKQILKGTPVADPFVIALAKSRGFTLVTEETMKDGGLKIPNICKHFGIDCINLEIFMVRQNWKF